MSPAPPASGVLPPDGLERLARVRLLVLDVDGTLTAGQVTYGDDGTETIAFSAQDGQGLVWLAQSGVKIAWISGRGSAGTERRARELGVHELHLEVGPKDAVLREVQLRLGIERSATAAMGDDLGDLALAAGAAFFAAPAGARPEVKQRADLVTLAGGGCGAVREFVDHLLRARGAFPAV